MDHLVMSALEPSLKKPKKSPQSQTKNPPQQQPQAPGFDLPQLLHLVVSFCVCVISPNLAGTQLPLNPVPPLDLSNKTLGHLV